MMIAVVVWEYLAPGNTIKGDANIIILSIVLFCNDHHWADVSDKIIILFELYHTIMFWTFHFK